MSESLPTPERYQMSARDRRRFLVVFFTAIVLLFVAGAVMFLVSFRHKSVCPDGKPWVSRTDNGIGAVVYRCQDGSEIKGGILP